MNLKKTSLHMLTLALALTGLASCGLMHDDLDDCAVKPEVNAYLDFSYTYNTSLANRFGSDVGTVKVYVFDENDKMVLTEEHSNYSTGNALKQDGFKIPLALAPGKYSAYAVAYGHTGGYQAALNGRGAKFRLSEPAMGQGVANLSIALDHDNSYVPHQNVMLDTLWSTRSAVPIIIPEAREPVEGDPQEEDIVVNGTVELMRVTNHLKISYFHENFPKNTDFSNYEVWIESRQPRDRMDVFGNYTGASSVIRCTPFKSTVEDDKNGNRCNVLDFGLPRFIMHQDGNQRVKLCFRNKSTGNVTEIALLADLLVKGNAAFAQHNWSDQEYLDREFEYDVQLVLNDKSWSYANVFVNILSWAKRVDNVHL